MNLNGIKVEGIVTYNLVDINTGETVYSNIAKNNITGAMIYKAMGGSYSFVTDPVNGSIVWSDILRKPHFYTYYSGAANLAEGDTNWKYTNAAVPSVARIVRDSETSYITRADSTSTVSTSATWSNRLLPPAVSTTRTINSIGIASYGSDIAGTGQGICQSPIMAFVGLDAPCLQSDSLFLDIYYKVIWHSDKTVDGDSFVRWMSHTVSNINGRYLHTGGPWQSQPGIKFSPLPIITDRKKAGYWINTYGSMSISGKSVEMTALPPSGSAKYGGYVQFDIQGGTQHVGLSGTTTDTNYGQSCINTMRINWPPNAMAGCVYSHVYKTFEGYQNDVPELLEMGSAYHPIIKPQQIAKANNGISHVIPKKDQALHDYKLFNIDDIHEKMGGPILTGSWDHKGTATQVGRHRTAEFPHIYRMKVLTTGNVTDPTPPKYTYEKHIMFNCTGYEKATLIANTSTNAGQWYCTGSKLNVPYLTGGAPVDQLLFGPRDGWDIERLNATIAYDKTSVAICNKKGYVIVYNIAAGEYHPFYNASITNPVAMAVKDDYLWIACRDSGLWRVNPKTEDALVRETGFVGIAVNKCFSVANGYNNSLWIIGEDGLARYDGVWGSGGWSVFNGSSTPVFNATTAYSKLGRLTVDTSSTAHQMCITKHWNDETASLGWWWSNTGTSTALGNDLRNQSGTHTDGYIYRKSSTARIDPKCIQVLGGRWLVGRLTMGGNSQVVEMKEVAYGATDWDTGAVAVSMGGYSVPVFSKVWFSKSIGTIGANSERIIVTNRASNRYSTLTTNMGILGASLNSWDVTPGTPTWSQQLMQDRWSGAEDYYGLYNPSVTTTTSGWVNYGYGLGVAFSSIHTIILEPGVHLEFSLKEVATNNEGLGTKYQLYNGVSYESIETNLLILPRWVNNTHATGSSLSYAKDSPGYKKYGWNGSAWEEGNVNGRPLHVGVETLEKGVNVRWSNYTGASPPTNSFLAGDCYTFVCSDGIWKTNATTLDMKVKEYSLPNDTLNLTNFATAGARTATGTTGYTTMNTRLSCTNMFSENTATHEWAVSGNNPGILVMNEKLYGDWVVRFHTSGRSASSAFCNGIYGIGAADCSAWHNYFTFKVDYSNPAALNYPSLGSAWNASSSLTIGTNFHSIINTNTGSSGMSVLSSLAAISGGGGLNYSNSLATGAFSYVQVSKTGNVITVTRDGGTVVNTITVSSGQKEMSIWYAISQTSNNNISSIVTNNSNFATKYSPSKMYPCEIVSNGTAVGELLGENGTPKTGKYADNCIGFDIIETEFAPRFYLDGVLAPATYFINNPAAGQVGFDAYAGVIYTNAADVGKSISVTNAVALYTPTPIAQT